MKKLLKTGMGMMLVSAFIFLPVVSYAQLNVNLVAETTGYDENVLDVNVDTYIDIDSDTYLKAEVNENVNVNIDSSSGQSNTKNNFEAKSSLRVNDSGVTVMQSSQVGSELDLEVFRANTLIQNKNVAKVEIESGNNEESKIEVVYKHKGKLFGFIPVTVKSTTIVKTKADGEVEVRSKKPWYAFLVHDKNYSRADLESRIKNNAIVKANTKVNMSADAKARIAEAVIAEVEIETKVDAGVGGSVN